MTKVGVVGRLSTQGWAITPEDKINAVFVNYQEAAESSSVLFRGNVLSLAYAQVMCDNDHDLLARRVLSDLNTILTHVFPEGVSLDVTAVKNELNSRYDLEIVGSVTENNVVYNISRYVTTKPLE